MNISVHTGIRIRVVYVVGFWGGPKFEADVRRLNPSATGAVSCLAEDNKLTVSVIVVKVSLDFALHDEVVVVRVDKLERLFYHVDLTEQEKTKERCIRQQTT